MHIGSMHIIIMGFLYARNRMNNAITPKTIVFFVVVINYIDSNLGAEEGLKVRKLLNSTRLEDKKVKRKKFN